MQPWCSIKLQEWLAHPQVPSESYKEDWRTVFTDLPVWYAYRWEYIGCSTKAHPLYVCPPASPVFSKEKRCDW
jgi:hypothetical protein